MNVKGGRSATWARVAVLLVFVAIALHGATARILRAHRELGYDSQAHLVEAFNLQRHRVFSTSCPGDNAWQCLPTATIVPDAQREPLLPALFAAGILLHPNLRSLPADEFFAAEDRVHSDVRVLLLVQVILLLGTAVLAMLIVLDMTGRPLPALATLYLVGLSPAVSEYLGHYQPEILAAFLVTLLSFLLIRLTRGWSRRIFALAGVALGLLVLSRASFQFMWLPLTGLFFLLAWRNRPDQKRILLGTGIFLLAYAATVGPWMARNALQTGRANIAGRGGGVLYLRAELDGMTGREYLGTFFYWSLDPIVRKAARAVVRPSDWERLKRDNPSGFFLQAAARRDELAWQYGLAQGDSRLMDEAKHKILRRPLRHLAVTLPVALRGFWVEDIRPGGDHGSMRPLFLNLALFGSLLALLVWSIVRRRPDVWLLLSPAIYSIAFYGLLTHYIPRYSVHLLPLAWISLTLVATCFVFPALQPVPINVEVDTRS